MTLAPELRSGFFVHVGRGDRWHTAQTVAARRTNCGIVLEGGAERYRVPTGEIRLASVCRRCATRHYDLAVALGLVDG